MVSVLAAAVVAAAVVLHIVLWVEVRNVGANQIVRSARNWLMVLVQMAIHIFRIATVVEVVRVVEQVVHIGLLQLL